MRILFLGNGWVKPDNYPNVAAGGSVQTWGVCKELVKRGHKVYIVRRSLDAKDKIVDGVHLIGIHFKGLENLLSSNSILFHIALLFSKFIFSFKSKSIIDTIHPDIICFIDRQTAIFPASSTSKKIFIIHSPEAMDFYRSYSIRKNRLHYLLFQLIKFLQDRLIKKSDYVVVFNKYIESYLRKRGVNTATFIRNGIDIMNLSNKGDEKFILYGGRFDWNKNVCELIQAFEDICNSYADYDLYLIGYGLEERKIMSLIEKRNLQSRVNVMSPLPRNEFLEFMGKCSFFVLPSFFEISPVTILEAMALGKPVVVRANMGTKDIVTHGYDGYLYSNKEQLKEYLELLLLDKSLRERMGCNARKKVEERFTFTIKASKYEEIFYKLISRNSNNRLWD